MYITCAIFRCPSLCRAGAGEASPGPRDGHLPHPHLRQRLQPLVQAETGAVARAGLFLILFFISFFIPGEAAGGGGEEVRCRLHSSGR